MEVYVQYILGACAAVLSFVLILGCILCWRSKKSSEREKIRPERVSVEMGSSPFQRSVTTGQSEIRELSPKRHSGDEELLFDSLRLINERSEIRRNSSTGSMIGLQNSACASPIGSNYVSPYTSRPPSPTTFTDWSNYSTETEELSGTADEGSNRPLPRLDFNILYSPVESTLVVTVTKVVNLPIKSGSTCDSFVKLYLLPQFPEALRTNVCKKSVEPEFNEHFQFQGLTIDEIDKSTLRFKVYIKEFWKKKKRFIGEVMFPCTDADLTSEIPYTYSKELNPNRSKTTRRRSKSAASVAAKRRSRGKIHVGYGELFVLLQYQAASNRMKVLVRKAENLGKTNWMPGTADHYVIVNATRRGKVVDSKETRTNGGYSPVWNEPFLFEVRVTKSITIL
ncbi:synaptotagmin-7-like isoform X2 [Ptychodera flava]|uniref:synaptotagmin-7-like isoform X2 n=1 Tax=Ptychodera flava TaxID=63121 RepID=UPI003969C446